MGDGVILIRRSALGDVVLIGSVTAALPGPVTVVTDPAWAGLVARLRGVDAVIEWPRGADPGAVAASLPPGRVVDLQGSPASLRLCLAARRPFRRVHKHGLRRRLRLRFAFPGPRPSVPEIYGQAVGVTPVPAPWLDLPPAPRTALALCPGAAWAPKQWRVDGLGAVGRAWNGPVHVLGGPGEEALCAAVAAVVPGAHVVVERGFDRTLAVLAGTRVAVTADAGLMHLAGATGASVVAVFGPTHPDDGFFVYPGAAVGRELGCRPCALHRVPTCREGHHGCMDLGADEVIAAVRDACAG